MESLQGRFEITSTPGAGSAPHWFFPLPKPVPLDTLLVVALGEDYPAAGGRDCPAAARVGCSSIPAHA